jgi:hypothetical protein
MSLKCVKNNPKLSSGYLWIHVTLSSVSVKLNSKLISEWKYLDCKLPPVLAAQERRQKSPWYIIELKKYTTVQFLSKITWTIYRVLNLKLRFVVVKTQNLHSGLLPSFPLELSDAFCYLSSGGRFIVRMSSCVRSAIQLVPNWRGGSILSSSREFRKTYNFVESYCISKAFS